jgi:riboflavin synthase
MAGKQPSHGVQSGERSMFTGLVEKLCSIEQLRAEPPGRRLWVAVAEWIADVAVGDSICLSGCCLTVVERTATALVFEAGPETLARTTLGELAAGSAVNLERSLAIGDRLGGHFVTGHVDATGELLSRDDQGTWSTFWFSLPNEFAAQVVSKGSIAVDGVSLTVVDVRPESFSVQLIPHTLAVTTLGQLQPGDRVNLETDLLAKYVARQLQNTASVPPSG